jgi:prophage tail gpP-like protein
MALVDLPEVEVTAPTPAVPLPRPRPEQAKPPSPANARATGEWQKEVAEIIIDGMVYRDWTSVQVVLADATVQPFPTFRFQCSEGKPLSKDFAAVRIKPGQKCIIRLAGEEVINGVVEKRVVAYNANSHGIEISGSSLTSGLYHNAAMTKTSEFRDKSWKQIAEEIIKPFGIGLKLLSPISGKPFPRANIPPGQSAFAFLETLARSRGIIMGSDTKGNLTASTGYAFSGGGDALIEGINILEGRETMGKPAGGGSNDYAEGQESGTDQKHGAQVAHDARDSNKSNVLNKIGSSGTYGPSLSLMEHPGDKQDAGTRAANESSIKGMSELAVTIVYRGWRKPSGGLWKPGQTVHVRSPMLILDDDLMLNKVTFTQDNRSGTRTTLDFKMSDGGTGYDYGKQQPNSQTSQSSSPPSGGATDKPSGVGHN